MRLMNKKLLIVILIFSVFLISTFWNNNLDFNFSKSNNIIHSKIFSNDEIIKEDLNRYSYWNKEGICNEHEGKIKFDFTGVDTLWEIKCTKSESLNISYNSDIKNGDFKVVLITNNKRLIPILEGTKGGTKDLTLEKGINKIKIVGKKAKGSLEIKFNSNKLEIIPISYK